MAADRRLGSLEDDVHAGARHDRAHGGEVVGDRLHLGLEARHRVAHLRAQLQVRHLVGHVGLRSTPQLRRSLRVQWRLSNAGRSDALVWLLLLCLIYLRTLLGATVLQKFQLIVKILRGTPQEWLARCVHFRIRTTRNERRVSER